MQVQTAPKKNQSQSGDRYDVVIVGARCAGATLATFLARKGASVLLLDRDSLPSDQVLSTHTIHPPGIDVLDEVGVGDAVREIAPPTNCLRLQKNDAVLDLDYREGRPEYCPRRQRLDGLLQSAAVAAGADLCDRTRVVELLQEGERVTGVAVISGDRKYTCKAGIVVGADGRHSTVAKLVDAQEYLAYDAPRAMYWGYWDVPSFWETDPAYPFGMYVGHIGNALRTIFQTDYGQLLIGSLPPVTEVDKWQADPLGALKADLALDPSAAPLVDGREPDGKIRGTVKERYFFRQAAGPGWALAGDAGHHKEFIIGDGITEALLQAKTLAEAISSGSDKALERWWRARDIEALPLYFFGQDEGALGPPLELQAVVFTEAARHRKLKSRVISVLEHQCSPYETFPVWRTAVWMTLALFRGRRGVLTDFFSMGRRGLMVNREWKKRKKLLAELERDPG